MSVDKISGTLRAQSGGHPPVICLQANHKGPQVCAMNKKFHMLESHPNDSRIRIDHSGTCQTLTSRMGTGGGNVPLLLIEEEANESTLPEDNRSTVR